jgi:AcrR family transcriptional regulator
MTRTTTDTRSALLEAAIDIIEESGESGFRIDAVLARVGVASTAIYHHFGSRDDLIDSANAERYLRTLYVINFATLVSAIAECRSKSEFEKLLRPEFAAAVSPRAQARRRTRVSVLGSAVSRPSLAAKVSEANTTYAREMAAAFRVAQERGWIRPELDLEAAAMWQVGQSTGRLMVEIGDPPCDLDAWKEIEALAVFKMLLTDD